MVAEEQGGTMQKKSLVRAMEDLRGSQEMRIIRRHKRLCAGTHHED